MNGRFVMLDALRGLAAMAVVLHHAGPMLADREIMPSGYLAVDFFFMLSGFVVAKAYEDRMASAPGMFLRRRFSRLYPVMALGIGLGALVVVAGRSPLVNNANLEMIAVLVASQLLFVPVLAGRLPVYSLNGVQWSLLFEALANVLHAVLLHRLGNRTLAALSGCAFLVLAVAGTISGSMAFGDTGANFLGGFARVVFSYTAGVLLARKDLPRVSPAFLGLPLLFFLPPGATLELAALLSFPLLIMAGAGSSAGRRLAVVGVISYPLYATHLPVLYLTRSFGWHGIVPLMLGFGAAVFVAAVVAWLLEPKGALIVNANQPGDGGVNDPVDAGQQSEIGSCGAAVPAES